MVRKSRSRRVGPAGRVLSGLLAVALLWGTGAARAADPLGRLFTTPRQRAQIDDLRNAEPKDEEIKLSRDELFSKQEPQKQREQIRDPIVLKGVVKRKDGLSTAWINDGNTYLGDPALEYIQISPPRGDTGEVTIKIPTRDTAVDLKVGESYEPASDRVIDSVPDAAVEH